MRILLISHSLVTRSNHRLPEELAPYPDVELTVFTPAWWPEESRVVHQEVTAGAGYAVRIGEAWSPRAPLPNEFIFRSGLAEAIRATQPDIIDVNEEPFSAAMGQILALRSVLAPQSKLLFYSFQNIVKRYPPPFSSIEQWAFRAAAAACVSASEIGAVLRKKGYSGEIVLNPPGVDSALFRPLNGVRPGLRASLGIAPAAPVLGYLGRLTPEKGVQDSIAALPLLPPETRLLIIGGGDREPLEAQAAALGVAQQVVFTGAINRIDMPRYFATIDALVVPSRTTPRWKEQFGRVIAEAMLCGVPVIGSASGAIPEVLSGNGIVVPEGNPAAIANAAWALFNQPQVAAALGRQARAYALEHYTWQRVAAQRVAVYRAVLG